MSPRLHSIFANIGALALVFVAFAYLTSRSVPASAPVVSIQQTKVTTDAEVASANAESISSKITATSSAPAITKPHRQIAPAQPAVNPTPNQITRVQNPYSFAPESAADLNSQARGALVNILCMPREGGSLSPISGSGVIIDPRGVILTNAHVAQYVLLSQSPRIDLSCTVRTGSPATARFHAVVLYIPPVWVNAHVSEINTPHPVGTGEHDYALLVITDSVDDTPLPSSFPALPYDTREAIGFTGDQILVASYPAEFLGGLAAESALFPVSSFTTIGTLLTFSANSPDLLSLGGIIEAQSGSSGGAVVNAWGRLIGLIVTTSEGQTTGERDLHALALSYINRDLIAQTQFDLPTMLGGNLAAEAQDFDSRVAPGLAQLYIDQISSGH